MLRHMRVSYLARGLPCTPLQGPSIQLAQKTQPPPMRHAGQLHSPRDTDSTMIGPPQCLKGPLEIPGGAEGRLLLGPGPANCSPRVREALGRPLLGHLHPEFTKIMDEAKAGLRYLFQTNSQVVCCFSGTGHTGMEGMIFNLLEPKDTLLVVDNGIWGQRAADMATRQGINVRAMKCTPGDAVTPSQLEEAVKEHRPQVVLIVHVESSTGVMQPLEGLGAICRKYAALCCVDTVASLGGAPFLMDDWLVDAVYTGTQKVLSAPPGLAPCALNDRAMHKIHSRATPVPSFYFDLKELANYWGCDESPRRYHHTGPISTIYALREALAELSLEGLKNYWARHANNAKTLHKELENLGLELFVENERLRSPTVTTVRVPEGVDWKAVTTHIMKNHQIEVSGGLGPTAGKVWRIGLMGLNSRPESVQRVVGALGEALGA